MNMSRITVINLDKERHLKFNLNALILAEKETGIKMSDMANEAKDGLSLEFLRAFLYAGLKWEDKKLTVEKVGDMIDFDNLSEVSEVLSEAMGDLK
ncbi:hypothetical protein vBCtySFA67_00013 [Clostridium phage vB_CtyS-FA67]|nr:hypothetical protein vBCtySFA67_00013 [Clostridium phage vB_CtyS-FA67]WMU08117.1 hypothetical protein vBCtySFA70_00013 [Clostridium phage vB_CtyS-FA70]